MKLKHVSMHGGKGRPHPLWDGSCGRMKEGYKRGRRDRQALLWVLHKGKKGERKGKGQTEEVSEKKGRRGEKNKEKR